MFDKIFKEQKAFDLLVLEKLGIEKPSINNKVLALLTEISELANEEGSLKYWKLKKTFDKEKVLNELVDVWKFTISIAIDLEVTPAESEEVKMLFYEKIQDQYIALSYVASIVSFLKNDRKNNIKAAISLLKGLQSHLNIRDEEFIYAWDQKSKTNFERLNIQTKFKK